MENLEMDEKEKEIAATNRLLDIIRGAKSKTDNPVSMQSDTPSEDASFEKSPSDMQKGTQEPKFEKTEKVSSEDEGQGFSVEESGQAPSKEPVVKATPKKAIPESLAQPPHPEPDVSEPQAPRKPPFEKEPSLLFPGRFLSKKQKGIWHRVVKKHEKKAIGLDIGSHSLKFVMLQKGISGLRVVDYRILELPSGQGEEENTRFRKNLKSLLFDTDLMNTKVVSSVSGPSVIVRHVQFPPMTQNELIQSLKWEAKSYIPFPMNEVSLDYQVLPKRNSSEKLDVILVAVTKKMLNSHLELLKSVPIEPDIVDIDPLVLINTYMALHSDREQGTVALIYIGARSSALSIYRPGSLFFTRDINLAGNAFTKRIQTQLNLSYAQAESLKCGQIPSDLDSFQGQDLAPVLKPVMSELINEVRRSLVYYDNQTGKRGFSQLVLTGGGSLLNGLPESLSGELGLDVEFLDPFKRLHVDAAGHSDLLAKEQAERLSLSMGLALRGTI